MKRFFSCFTVVFLLLVHCSTGHAATAVKKNGVCGSVNGTSVSSKPTSNLCGTGITASAVNGTGPWNWYCYGVSGGVNVLCSANLIPLNVNQFDPNMKQNSSVNVIVGGGKSPYSLTANPANAVSIVQNGNLFNVTARENGKTVALVIRDSKNSSLNKTLTIAKADPPKDVTKPTASFSLTPSSITQGASVTINYTVADAGGLKQIELWRSADNKNWSEVTGQRKTLSGNGPIQGSFTDTPPAVGTYYYGITPVDKTGNKGESGSKSVTVTKVVPLMAVSLSLDKLAPLGTATMTVTGGTPPYKISSILPLNSLTVKATGNNAFTLTAGVIATTASITVQDATSVSKPVTKTIVISGPPPSVKTVKGTTYGKVCSDSSICNSAWKDYLLVGYSGKPYKEIVFEGENLDVVTSVSGDQNYSVVIVGKPTKKSMTVQVAAKTYETRPTDSLTIKMNGDPNWSKTIKVTSAFNDYQLYGQCTWYAWHVMRNKNGQDEIASYSKGIQMQGTANKKGEITVNLPRNNSILMNGSHTAYVDRVTQTAPTTNKDGTTITYTLSGHHANWDSRDSIASFTATMVVTTSKDGKKMTITEYPKAGAKMTQIYY